MESANCANKLMFCKARMCPCDHVGCEDECPFHESGCQVSGGRKASLGTIVELYMEMVGLDGRAPTAHDRAVIRELRNLMAFAGLTDESPAEAVGYDVVREYVNSEARKNISKQGMCWRIQTIVGRKARIFYRRHGFDVRAIDVPSFRDDSAAYRTVSPGTLFKILKWYRSLQFEPDGRGRIFSMMMLKYAMRNGDVRNLKWSNFEKDGMNWRLVYTPHKTRESAAGRTVSIWLDLNDQIELQAWMGDAGEDDFVIPRETYRRGLSINTLERKLNDSLREAAGFSGSKGLYELRKLCIDTVFHTMGAEAASAYSGDDYKTVKFHYCDPSSMNLHGLSDNAYSSLITGYRAA